MGRGIEEPFYPAGQAVDSFCMDPELVNKADGLHGHYYSGVEAQQWHPGPEQKSAGKIAGPVLPQGGGQVILTGGVVDHVRGPEEAYRMAGAVKPVIAQIICKEAQYPGPPYKAQGK